MEFDNKEYPLSPPISDLDRLIDRHDQAVALATEGLRLLTEAIHVCPGFGIEQAISNVRWYGDDPAQRYAPEIKKAIRKATWIALLDKSKLSTVMSGNDLEKLKTQIAATPPDITRENVVSTFIALYEQRFDSFRRGLVELFKNLCRQYRSNDAFRIGKRVILDGALSGRYWNHHSSAQDRVNDLFRIMTLLDGKDPGQVPREEQADELIIHAVHASQANYQHDYFEVRMFANGNLHLWFKRQDLVDKANQIIADHYEKSLAKGNRPGN